MLTKGGGRIRQIMKMDDKGARGVRQILTWLTQGGGHVGPHVGLTNAEITGKNIDFYPTHQDIFIIFVKLCNIFQKK